MSIATFAQLTIMSPSIVIRCEEFCVVVIGVSFVILFPLVVDWLSNCVNSFNCYGASHYRVSCVSNPCFVHFSLRVIFVVFSVTLDGVLLSFHLPRSIVLFHFLFLCWNRGWRCPIVVMVFDSVLAEWVYFSGSWLSLCGVRFCSIFFLAGAWLNDLFDWGMSFVTSCTTRGGWDFKSFCEAIVFGP